MIRKGLILTAVITALVAVGHTAASGSSDLPPNWHVHDCTVSPCVLPHAATAFFPYILHETVAQYLGDPAECPNATDKTLLPPGLEEGEPLRAGVCITRTAVIHLRSIPLGDPAPEGWTLIPATVPGAISVINGVTYVTYFLVTAG